MNDLTNCTTTTATKQLQTLLTETQAELTKTKRSLVVYARKNEELLVRITEQRLAEEKLQKVESLYFLHVSSFKACAPFVFVTTIVCSLVCWSFCCCLCFVVFVSFYFVLCCFNVRCFVLLHYIFLFNFHEKLHAQIYVLLCFF